VDAEMAGCGDAGAASAAAAATGAATEPVAAAGVAVSAGPLHGSNAPRGSIALSAPAPAAALAAANNAAAAALSEASGSRSSTPEPAAGTGIDAALAIPSCHSLGVPDWYMRSRSEPGVSLLPQRPAWHSLPPSAAAALAAVEGKAGFEGGPYKRRKIDCSDRSVVAALLGVATASASGDPREGSYEGAAAAGYAAAVAAMAAAAEAEAEAGDAAAGGAAAAAAGETAAAAGYAAAVAAGYVAAALAPANSAAAAATTAAAVVAADTAAAATGIIAPAPADAAAAGAATGHEHGRLCRPKPCGSGARRSSSGSIHPWRRLSGASIVCWVCLRCSRAVAAGPARVWRAAAA
jgi:hypothetical protein